MALPGGTTEHLSRVAQTDESLAHRPVLTAKGEAQVAAQRGEQVEQVPGHYITVTGNGPFGRAWFECSCGIEQVRASKKAANLAALAHFDAIGGVR